MARGHWLYLCFLLVLCTSHGVDVQRDGSGGTNALKSLCAVDYQTCTDKRRLFRLLLHDKHVGRHHVTGYAFDSTCGFPGEGPGRNMCKPDVSPSPHKPRTPPQGQHARSTHSCDHDAVQAAATAWATATFMTKATLSQATPLTPSVTPKATRSQATPLTSLNGQASDYTPKSVLDFETTVAKDKYEHAWQPPGELKPCPFTKDTPCCAKSTACYTYFEGQIKVLYCSLPVLLLVPDNMCFVFVTGGVLCRVGVPTCSSRPTSLGRPPKSA